MDSLELNNELQPEVTNTPVAEKPAANDLANTNVEPQTAETPKTPKTAPAVEPKRPQTKAELVAELKQAVASQNADLKDTVETLKQAFYKIYNAEQEEARRLFAQTAAEGEEYQVVADADETAFKQLLNDYKKLRAAQNASLEKEKEQNQLRKQHIIEQMKSLVEEGDVSGKINEFKQLQQQWKEIGIVSPTVANELWKNYNLYQEQFYDQVKINNELREYDFKKNLELKTALCEAAEKLAEQADVVAAFRDLQKLHDDWKDSGPVARDLRESLWKRFQDASTVINKKHQDFFQSLHQQEDDNLQKKTELCEKLELIELDALDMFKKWEEKTKEVLDIQAQWRTIGFAPRKVNQQIYDRYRVACDRFFDAKTTYYKQVKAELTANLDKKRALCEQAEALKDSTEWKETTDKLVELQKAWKTIGPVAKKYSDEIWKRFQTACDYFFDQKKNVNADQRASEQQNLQQKKALIEQIAGLELKESAEAALKNLRALIAQFNAVGYVPFKDKEKIYKQFHAAVDKQFDALHVDAAQRRMDNFRNNLEDLGAKGEGKLADERRKLARVYENLKAEIAICENNMGFFTTAKSKSPNPLMKEVERKINSLKEELKVVAEKIAIIDKKL